MASYLPHGVKLSEMVSHYEYCDFAVAFPALYQLLTHARDAAGQYRAGASLSIFCDGGKLKASIYDRATSMVWFHTLTSSERMIEAIEEALVAGKGEWRAKKK
jgi:hypothetical protein